MSQNIEKYNKLLYIAMPLDKAVQIKASLAYALPRLLSITLLLLFSSCSGDNQAVSGFEYAIADRIISHFSQGESLEPSETEAEFIADEVVERIVHNTLDNRFIYDPELGQYVEAIVEKIYDDNWHTHNTSVMSVTDQVINALSDYHQVNAPLVFDLYIKDYNQTVSFQTYVSGEVFYRMHYHYDCGNGDDVKQVSYLFSHKPASSIQHDCEYDAPGIYQITITQQLTAAPLGLPQLKIAAGGKHLDGVRQWGSGYWLSMRRMFKSVTSDFTFPDEVPLTAQLQDMTRMFDSATNFNQSLEHWDVSSVKDMGAMFNNVTNFNQPLNNWDVSSVTAMRFMFYGASDFNQAVNNWDISNVINMNGMFQNTLAFNQSLNEWESIKHQNLIDTNIIAGASNFDNENCTWCP